MERGKAIGILLGMVKDRVGTDDMDTTIRMEEEKEAVNQAIADMKVCAYHNGEWISCRERLPESSGTYLTVQDRDGNGGTWALPLNVCTYRFNKSDGRWHGCQVRSVIDGILYWMPLPKIPESKTEIEALVEYIKDLMNQPKEEKEWYLMNRAADKNAEK